MRRETSGANFVYATPRFAILVHFFHTFGADAPPLILKKSTSMSTGSPRHEWGRGEFILSSISTRERETHRSRAQSLCVDGWIFGVGLRKSDGFGRIQLWSRVHLIHNHLPVFDVDVGFNLREPFDLKSVADATRSFLDELYDSVADDVR